MVDKLVLGIVIICALTMCSVKPKTTEQNEIKATETELFKSVYDTLDQMKISITLTADNWGDLYQEHAMKYGIREGDKVIDHPFARLAENGNFKAIIFVSTDETGSPVIMTFDKKGDVIDNLWLLNDSGGNDPSSGTSELATINKDLTIQLIDSTWTYDLGSDGNRIESSVKLTTTDELYRILDSGKIEKIR
jgi:hypothetical protein